MVTISIDASVLLLDLSASEVIARGSLDEDWGWGVRMIPRSQVRGSTRQKSGEQEEERDDFLLIFTSDSALIVADMELNGLAAYPLEESSARATIHMAIFLFIPELSLIVLRPRNEMVFIRITAYVCLCTMYGYREWSANGVSIAETTLQEAFNWRSSARRFLNGRSRAGRSRGSRTRRCTPTRWRGRTFSLRGCLRSKQIL